jgi:hypothetical protein
VKVGPGGAMATGARRPQPSAGVVARRQQLIDVLNAAFPAASHVKSEPRRRRALSSGFPSTLRATAETSPARESAMRFALASDAR